MARPVRVATQWQRKAACNSQSNFNPEPIPRRCAEFALPVAVQCGSAKLRFGSHSPLASHSPKSL